MVRRVRAFGEPCEGWLSRVMIFLMADTMPRLVAMPHSPWSERARWALDHHRVEYELVRHTPLLGERRLRRLVGPKKKRATAPVLVFPGAVLTESWTIVQHADRHGHSELLLPEDRLKEVRSYADLADRTLEAARALVVRALLANPEALDEALPPGVPGWLRPCLRPLTRLGARWFARKYDVRLDGGAEHLATMRTALGAVRAKLAKSSPYLLGSFTYADIAMAVSLQSVAPVADRFIALGPATRRAWSLPALAAEFPDVLTWRDQMYERHRAIPSAPALLAAVPSSPLPAR